MGLAMLWNCKIERKLKNGCEECMRIFFIFLSTAFGIFMQTLRITSVRRVGFTGRFKPEVPRMPTSVSRYSLLFAELQGGDFAFLLITGLFCSIYSTLHKQRQYKHEDK
jgi:hypothetical protein